MKDKIVTTPRLRLWRGTSPNAQAPEGEAPEGEDDVRPLVEA